jgi:hypothetical protein
MSTGVQSSFFRLSLVGPTANSTVLSAMHKLCWPGSAREIKYSPRQSLVRGEASAFAVAVARLSHRLPASHVASGRGTRGICARRQDLALYRKAAAVASCRSCVSA